MKVIVILQDGFEYEYTGVKNYKESDFEITFESDEGNVRVMFNNLSIMIVQDEEK